MISFYVMGAGLIIGSVVVSCQPLVTKLEDRRTKIHLDQISVTINKLDMYFVTIILFKTLGTEVERTTRDSVGSDKRL